jgi:hypothetical protein
VQQSPPTLSPDKSKSQKLISLNLSDLSMEQIIHSMTAD